MKVGIVIIVYNISSEIMILQIEAIRKFCKDDFTIEIIDNSTDIQVSTDIRYHCERLGVNYKKTFAISLNGSQSHSFAANLSYQKLKDQFDIFLYLDHDCIPVLPFSVVEILGEEKVMAGIGQHEVNTFMWPGCVAWRNDKVDNELIDFSPCHELRQDTGSGLRKVIEKYGKENCIFFDEAYHQNPDFVDNRYGYYSMINGGVFCHCVNGSNWAASDRHEERINSFANIIREKINANVE